MIKKVAIVLLSLMALLSVGVNNNVSKADVKEFDPMLRVENQRINDGYFTDLNNEVDNLNNMDEGTIIVRFRHTGSSIMSLFSLSNSNLADGHFHLYVTPDAVGSENRYEEPDKPKQNIHISAPTNLEEGQIYTLAMSMDKEKGYKYYLDGELIKEDTTSPKEFLNHVYKPNSAQLGRTERAFNRNEYHFNGDIDFTEVYNEPLPVKTLKKKTQTTAKDPLINPMPDDAYISNPKSIFYPGFMNSNNYRIPALLSTEQGTLIAGIDRRVNNGADSPNDIDSVIRRSFDGGETWEDDGIVINDYPDEASNIDLAFLQDKSNERIFSVVDGFPHGAGLMGGFGTNAYKGTGFKTINGTSYMFLNDKDDNEYTIREEGKVYDEKDEITNYVVDEYRNLYENGKRIDNIFSKSTPLKPYKTSYLEMYYSDNEGETWTAPIDLNDQVKEDWMIFLGTGPGNGIQLTEGENQGRLVFPIYFLNDNNRQASAVIYSDDNGKSWQRGESPNEGRIVGNGDVINEKDFNDANHEITEAQVIEMPDGQLKMFMRNHSGYAQIATSFDGGESWDAKVVTEKDLIAPYSQMTAINYDGKIDGEEAVIFSSANHHTSRINGTVRVGLIEKDGTHDNGRFKYKFNWKYEQLVKSGVYGYSSLANLGDDSIGLFYEGTSNTEMDYIKFNTDFLKWDKHKPAPEPKIDVFQVVPKTPNVYQPGDEIRVEVSFDDNVIIMGDKELNGTIGEEEISLELSQQTDESRYIFEGNVPNLKSKDYKLELKLSEDLDVYNVYGKSLTKHNLVEKISIGALHTNDIKKLIEQFEEDGAFENDQVVHSLQLHLTTVSHYEKKEAVNKVLKHMNGFKDLLDYQQENNLISEEAFKSLYKMSDSLIEKWE